MLYAGRSEEDKSLTYLPVPTSKNCRLLYLVGQLGTGGLERQLCFILEGMDRKRYLPEVVVWNFSEDDKFVSEIRLLGVPLHALPNAAPRTMKLKIFRRMVMQVNPEVVHSYSFFTNFAVWYATRGTKIIAIGAVRGDFIPEKEACGPWLGRLNARWPQSQIYNNFLAAENARCSKSFYVPKQVYVVRNGLNLDRFHSLPLNRGGKACILGVGSLLPVKRWDRLLVAGLELKRRGLDFLVRIVGDGPLRGALKAQAQVIGVAECTQFIGHSNDIPGLLADASLLAHTSDTEGCPNAVMEAMACGRAVVATDVGDVPSLVENGKTGYIVPREDNAALVERITKLITDLDLCRRMGEAGRVKAEREFGLDRLISETLAAYRAAGWKDS